MKKRILSVLLVVAMLAAMVVMPVYATDTATQSTSANYDLEGKCPHCGVALESINWTEITAEDHTARYDLATDGGHYRLMEDITSSGHAFYMTPSAIEVVFDFNGHTITVGNNRPFMTGYINSSTTIRDSVLHIIDSSEAGTGGTISSTTSMGGGAIYNYNIVNVYGGTYIGSATHAASGPVLYNNGGTMNIYGGTFDASAVNVTADYKHGGVLYATGDTSIYGGTFIGGSMSGAGDAIYVRAGDLLIAGGSVDGEIIVASSSSSTVNASLTIQGNPVLSNVNLADESIVESVNSTTGAATTRYPVKSVTVGELTEGASIGVTAAAGTTFTDVFDNAQTYLEADYFYSNLNYADIVVSEGALAMSDNVCPHCGENYSDITWNEWTFDTGNNSKWGATDSETGEATNYVVSGHYYLTGDLSISAQYYIGATESDDTASIEAGTMPQLDVCLDTRGFDITASSTNRAFYVYAPHKLAVCSSVGSSELSTKATSSGAVLYAGSNTTLKVFDCDLTNTSTSTAGSNAGGVTTLGGGATVLFENCTMESSRTSKTGGIIQGSSANITLNNCTVGAGTTTGNGGTIYMTSGTLTVNGGTIEGGEAGAYGAAIFMSTGKLYLNGATITSGTADPDNGVDYNTNGVYKSSAGTVEINGGSYEEVTLANASIVPVLTGTVDIDRLELVRSSTIVDVSGMNTDSTITLVAQEGAFTEALTDAAAYQACFTSGVEGMNVEVKDNALVLAAVAVEKECPHCDGQIREFTAYTYDGTVDILEGGHYYLYKSAEATSEVGVGMADDSKTEDVNEAVVVDVVIDLNGNSINNTSRAFTVRKDSQLYLFDSTGGSQIVGGQKNIGSCIYANTGAKITLNGGIYTQYERAEGSYDDNGGVIYVSGAELNVIGDTVVTGGTTSGFGGNIYATGSSVMIKDNAQVTNGTSTKNGGNIYATGESTVAISDDAVISGGYAPNGGNLYMPGGAALTMTGGAVSNGTAYNDGVILTHGRGGNMYLGAAEHTISGGVISGGTAQVEDSAKEFGGGNIYLYAGGVLNLTGGTVSNGSSGTYGGNIATMGTLNLGAAAVSGGSADVYGDDIYVFGTGVLNVAETATGSLGMGFAAALLGQPIYGNAIANTTATTLNATMTLDGTMGNAPIIAQDNALYVVGGGAAVEDLAGNVTYYPTAAEAVAAFNEAEDTRIIVCGAEELVLGAANYSIDIKSCNVKLSGVEGSSATCFDTANQDYETYGLLTLDENVTLNNLTQTNTCGHDFFTLETNGTYSFHILDMEITAVSLKTKSGGLYYEAKYYCDDALAAQVDTFGIVTQLNSMPVDFGSTTLYSEIPGTSFVTNKAITGATMNGIIGDDVITDSETGAVISNSERGQMKVYAAPYVILTTGAEKIGTDEVGMSLYDCCDAIDTMITELNAGDADDQAKAANYIAYMTNLMTNVWGTYELGWTFDNFPTTTEA